MWQSLLPLGPSLPYVLLNSPPPPSNESLFLCNQYFSCFICYLFPPITPSLPLWVRLLASTMYPLGGRASPAKQRLRQGLGPRSRYEYAYAHTHTDKQMHARTRVHTRARTHMHTQKGGQKETSRVEEGTRSQSVLLHSSLSLHYLWT